MQAMESKDRNCALAFYDMSLYSSVQCNLNGDFIEGLENYGGSKPTKLVTNHALVFVVRELASTLK